MSVHISTISSSFTKPNWTREQWEKNDREIDMRKRAEEQRTLLDKINNSGIPISYRDSDLRKTPIEIRRWLEGFLKGDSRGLLIQGEPGSGKTSAACACSMAAIMSGYRARFATLGSIIREIKSTYSGYGTEESVIAKYSGAKLLVIDDLGKEKPTEFSISVLFSIVDTRLANNRPTIITTQYGKDIVGRLMFNDTDAETAKALMSRIRTYDRCRIGCSDLRTDGKR